MGDAEPPLYGPLLATGGGMEDPDGGRGRHIRKTYRWIIVDRQLETTKHVGREKKCPLVVRR